LEQELFPRLASNLIPAKALSLQRNCNRAVARTANRNRELQPSSSEDSTFLMLKGRIRVRLKAYDARVIDRSAEKIVDAAIRTGAKVVGPIPLPTDRELFTVIRSPHIDKRSRESFEILTHKRLIDIEEPTPKTIDELSNLDLPAGVGVEVKM